MIMSDAVRKILNDISLLPDDHRAIFKQAFCDKYLHPSFSNVCFTAMGSQIDIEKTMETGFQTYVEGAGLVVLTLGDGRMFVEVRLRDV